jgi:glycosyltransferase involved in cell wall biosynthesis
MDAVVQRNGPIDALISTAWRDIQASVHDSIDAAVASRADVLFAHDAPTAETALARRMRGQRVWMFLHTPMPLALYLAWSWGVPEARWEQIVTWPDVASWIRREREVIAQVDEVFLPCPEAKDEFTRVDAPFGAVLSGAGHLLTGGVGPVRTRPAASRVDLRRHFGLPPDAPVALFIGNAQPYRGLDLLLESLKSLPSPRELPGVLAVAGPAIQHLPLSRRIHALGPVADVADLLAAADVVVNVNRFSLFDLSTIEAIEAGRALLLHATGGNKTFARLGAGVVTLADVNPATIARGLTACFEMSAVRRDELERDSRACYDAHTTLRHFRDRHAAAYAAAMSVVRQA